MRNLLDNQYVQSPATISAKCNILQRIFSYVGILSILLNMQSNSTQAQSIDTIVCDNGGFEDDFEYYFGSTSTYYSGSNGCIPLDTGNQAIFWSSVSLPNYRRFQIVSGGTDSLVNISRTRFGSKSLLLNNKYGLESDNCQTNYEINKLVKRFKVTEENREFTIWYAAVLENPGTHVNKQPFFSIRCDLALYSDLCFDASILNCEQDRSDSLCDFDAIDSIDWACHRIKIPADQVGEIATLEIVAADCAQGCHFGYAYIDGICEDCTTNIFGSAELYEIPFDSSGLGIKYFTCEGEYITVCGNYELPSVCGEWWLESFDAPGFDIENLTIDSINQIFCFDIPKSELNSKNCHELFVALHFKSITAQLPPIFSNSIEICEEMFIEFETELTTGVCQNNGTSTMLSDDYYYIQLELLVNDLDTWTFQRVLDDPYPNESGTYLLHSGRSSTNLDLGPFFIQEGGWKLIIDYGECLDTIEVSPPAFCSGCNKFYRTRIFEITCSDNDGDVASSNPFDDTWSFTINVPGLSGNYSLTKDGGSPVSLSYGASPTHDHVIQVGTIGLECIKYTLSDGVNCISTFIVCPPKPCSNDCDLEAYLTDVYCENEDTDYYAELDVSGAGTSYYCYESFAISDPGNTVNSNYYQGSLSNTIGPFTEDVYVIVYLCPSSTCTCDRECFRIIYIPFPDCENLEYRRKKTNYNGINTATELVVIPNPIKENEFVLQSFMKNTNIEIYNSSSKLILQESFAGLEYRYRSDLPPGLYIVRYKNSGGSYSYLKVIKF